MSALSGYTSRPRRTSRIRLGCPTSKSLPTALALSCIACDIPASRKVCGFVGHNARLGCNKCFKEFDTLYGSMTNYSGFDRGRWPSRMNETHRSHCAKVLSEVTPTAIQKAESGYGVRYSILLALPYFDPVTFTVLDPMHNLFLGTGKHAFKVWLEKELISKLQLVQMEEKIQAFSTPVGVGRLPYSISSGFGGFTANQWSNWITIYSPILLKGILPDSHLRCWLLYVKACVLLRKGILNKQEVELADSFLLHFCKAFQELYGPEACTANMHLHIHLKDSVLDYGPPQAFWCYAFERFNGVLGSIHTNRRSIESQLMEKFSQEQDLTALSLPKDVDFQLLLSKLKKESATSSTVSEHGNSFLDIISIASSKLSTVSSFNLSDKQSVVKLLPPLKKRF